MLIGWEYRPQACGEMPAYQNESWTCNLRKKLRWTGKPQGGEEKTQKWRERENLKFLSFATTQQLTSRWEEHINEVRGVRQCSR
jgi:hypothetical protein